MRKIKSIAVIIVLFLITNNPLYAQNELQLLSKALAEASQDTQRVLIYRDYLKYYLYKNTDSASHYANLAKTLANKIKYERGIALIYAAEATIADSKGQLDDARALSKKALELFYHLDLYDGVAGIYNSLGILEAKQTNYKLAANYFFRALNIYDKHNDKDGQIQCYIKIGTLNIYLGNFEKSIYYFNKAKKLNAGKNKEVELGIYNNLGTVYGIQSNFNEAIKYLKLSKIISDEIGGNRATSQLLMNIGIAYYQLRQPDSAKKYYNEALAIANKFLIIEDKAQILFNIGIMYEDTDIKKALQYMDSSLVIARKLQKKPLEAEIHNAQHLLKKEMGDFKGALESLSNFHTVMDSIKRDENKRDVDLLQSNFELDKSRTEVKELELINQQKELQNSIYILMIIAIVAILIIVTFFAINRNKLNNKLVHSIHVRDKLLSIIAHDLKSPINNIVGLLDLFESGELNEEDKYELLKTLKNHTVLTLETLENILKWGQAQIRGIHVEAREVNLDEVVQKNIELLRITAIQKGITIKYQNTNESTAFIDADHINFIIRNLLSNALKFSNRSSEVIIQHSVDGNSKHVIKVIDQGMGMASSTLNALFTDDPDLKYGTGNEKGSGLGLMLCKEFIEANNGEIIVESVLGKGSNFTIIF